MRTTPRLVAAVCAAALAAGCSPGGSDPDQPATTEAPETAPSAAPSTEHPSPGASSSPDDPFAMPDPVTEEYVDLVVNTIYEEWGAIVRNLIEQPGDPTAITPVATRERITEVFDGQYLRRRLDEADQRLRGDREGMLPADEYGHVKFHTRRLLQGTPQCLVAIGDFDTSETSSDPSSTLAALSLEPVVGGVPDGNPTNWKIIDLVPNTRNGDPMPDEVMLEATMEDFEGVLDVTCEGSAP